MGLKRFPASLHELPAFTYSKAIPHAIDRHTRHGRPKSTLHKATAIYEGRKIFPRRITENVIDVARWETNGRIRKPGKYPAGLRHPLDILTAVLYKKPRSRKAKTAAKKSTAKKPTVMKPTVMKPVASYLAAAIKRCASCHTTARTSNQVCDCTTTAWDNTNTPDWQAQNIDLRWVSDLLGVGAYALNSFTKYMVLGEYLGELVPGSFLPEKGTGGDRYFYDVKDEENETVAFVDALRVGNWTRFVNHSCDPNTACDMERVGRGLRHVVVARKNIKKGEQVTLDYGKEYWDVLHENQVWCECGASTCKYSETASAPEVPSEKGRKVKKKKRVRK
ncbi:hypothetical protein N0V95_000373 [Ascochyta clinopodiicola]|nr:hypothetical protein N0V95_000373 [Ascochyta clinopodiicola]